MQKHEWLRGKDYSPRENNREIGQLELYQGNLEDQIRDYEIQDGYHDWLIVELAKVRRELRERKRGIDFVS